MSSAVLQSEIVRDLERRHAQVASDVRTHISGLTKAQLGWKPAPRSWSVEECLAHLVVAHDEYWPNIQEVVGSTARRAPAGNRVRSTWLGGALLRAVDPNRAKRMKHPRVFDPGRSALPEGVVEAFLSCHIALGETIRETADLDWHRIRVVSPVSRFLRFRLGDVYRVLVHHSQRHLLQARAVVATEAFPVE